MCQVARQFVEQHTDINALLFNQKDDQCFCDECWSEDAADIIKHDGPTPFVVPRGWMRFGLALPPRARTLKIEEEWSVSFHGVKSMEVLHSILHSGGLMKPGDTLLGGEKLVADKTNTRSPQSSVFYTSPTVRYAGLSESSNEVVALFLLLPSLRDLRRVLRRAAAAQRVR